MTKADLCTVNIIACFFFLMLKVCILTILINQLELIETRIAISVCRITLEMPWCHPSPRRSGSCRLLCMTLARGKERRTRCLQHFFFPPPLSLRAPLGQGRGVPVRSGSGFAPLRAGSPPPSRERTGPPRIPLPGARRGPLPTPGRLPLSVLFFSPSLRFAEPCPGDASRLHLCLRAALSPRSPSRGAWDGKGVRASAVGEQTLAVCASGFLFLITIFFFLRSHQISVALSDGSKQIHEVEVCFSSSLLFI